MATISNIALDTGHLGEIRAAVAFNLSRHAARSQVYRFCRDSWEVEFRSGSRHVVARTSRKLEERNLVDSASDQIQRGLDLQSVEFNDHLTTSSPSENHISFARHDAGPTVYLRSVTRLPVDIGPVSISVRGADGSVSPSPAKETPEWSPAFRFYRLSQTSGDLFEAYRNMFLGLEALLHQLHPKDGPEREKDWLVRALTLATAGELSTIDSPNVSGTITQLAERLYKVRNYLFHAKTGRTLIPNDRTSLLEVSDCYQSLLSLWVRIAQKYLLIKCSNSGRLTHQVFRGIMDTKFINTRLSITTDESVRDKKYATSGLDRLSVHQFENPIRVEEVQPGEFALLSHNNVSDFHKSLAIQGILTTKPDSTILLANPIGGVLSLAGVDFFDTRESLILTTYLSQRKLFP